MSLMRYELILEGGEGDTVRLALGRWRDKDWERAGTLSYKKPLKIFPDQDSFIIVLNLGRRCIWALFVLLQASAVFLNDKLLNATFIFTFPPFETRYLLQR